MKRKTLFSKELYLNRRLFEDTIDCSIDVGVISREQNNNKWLDRILDDSQKKAMFKKKIFDQLDLWTWTVPGKDNNQRLSQVSENLVISILDWYHEVLQHPGSDRMNLFMNQYYHYNKMIMEIKDYVKECAVLGI